MAMTDEDFEKLFKSLKGKNKGDSGFLQKYKEESRLTQISETAAASSVRRAPAECRLGPCTPDLAQERQTQEVTLRTAGQEIAGRRA